MTTMDIGNRAGPERLPGASLPRNLAMPGSKADAQIDAFISRRHDQRVKAEGERDEEAAWRESERRHTAARREANRAARVEYHRAQAVRLRAVLEALIRDHEQEAEKYLPKGDAA